MRWFNGSHLKSFSSVKLNWLLCVFLWLMDLFVCYHFSRRLLCQIVCQTSFINNINFFTSLFNYMAPWSRLPSLPASQVTGHAVQSLNGVMMQSFLQGSSHGRTVLGRGPSGHLGSGKHTQNTAGMWSNSGKNIQPNATAGGPSGSKGTKTLRWIFGSWTETKTPPPGPRCLSYICTNSAVAAGDINGILRL